MEGPRHRLAGPPLRGWLSQPGPWRPAQGPPRADPLLRTAGAQSRSLRFSVARVVIGNVVEFLTSTRIGWIVIVQRGDVFTVIMHTGTVHYDETASLVCPSCDSEYLHQYKVTVFNRSEDADLTSVTTVVGGLAATHLQPSEGCRNPSSRRQGVAIEFNCEGCRNRIELTLAQHKGATHIGWRVIGKRDKSFSMDDAENIAASV
jgi:hypothetical protein